jgi:hypothetical protein
MTTRDDLMSELRKIEARLMASNETKADAWDIGLAIEQLTASASALEAKDAEIAHQAGWIQRLQMALLFWMPGVDLRLDDATRELAADDAMLLAGYSGPLDIERWGDGILERAIAAESRITDLERQLAEETERCALLEKLHAFVVEHYANQDMNHMDFRVDAYVIAAALEQSKEGK